MNSNTSIDKCVDNALQQLVPQCFGPQSNTVIHEDECEIFVWPQTWSDASCGSGGPCAQMITTKSTIVVIGPTGDACVYHGGNLAYKVESVDEKFRKGIDNKDLPGKIEA